VEGALTQRNLPVLDRVPIVSMRIAAVKGSTVEEIRADSTRSLNWAYRREYRSSYRSHLTDSETLVQGAFVPEVSMDTIDVVPVSVEQDIANRLDVALGDTIVFDVQGIDIATRVASIRTVDWRRMQTNFYFVFPDGVLEEAPQFQVILTRAETEVESAAVQSDVVRIHPNVSSIDVSLVMDVFDAIFSRIALIIRFMALFTILTGLIVLSGAVLVSRYQRVEESVLLKTIGASRATVLRIMSVEYLVLGLLAASTGLILALGGGWALAHYVFEVDFVLPGIGLTVLVVVEIGLTVLIGLFNSRGVYARKPLDVLRAEL
jgi:putative ABC transport system permease protein